MKTLTLTGLDGSNPLAFLAALGTLRALTRVWIDARVALHWKFEGTWRPVISCCHELDADILTETLSGNLSTPQDMFPEDLLNAALACSPKNKKGEVKWKGKLRFPVLVFRNFLQRLSQDPHLQASSASEFGAVWGCEIQHKPFDDIECVDPTPFNFTAGNQEYISIIECLSNAVQNQHIREALFGPWQYANQEPSLRWDPIDDRRYALRWRNPAKEDIRTVWGANRLALEGLVFFPTLPVDGQATTVGIAAERRQMAFRWPIWETRLQVDSVRSLIACPWLADERKRQAIGVRQCFESAIIQPQGYYRNFSPAQPV